MKYADSKESKENGTGESSRILYSLSHQGSLLRHTQRQNRSDYSVCWSVGMERPFSSVQFSHSVMSDFLRPHEMQHARPPCPTPTPAVHSNSSPSSRWCHLAISSSIVPFSSCPQPLPASASFPMSQLFTWGGQSIGVSTLASVLPMNTQDWSLL